MADAAGFDALSTDELRRYGRQTVLPEVGPDGQRRLKSSRVLIVGLGGLGSPAALYLAAAGVGHLTLLEPDRVEISNLQRQILYDSGAQGQPKAEVALARLRQLNPTIEIESRAERLTGANARDWVSRSDVAIDATDNFRSRDLLNSACLLEGKPLVSASLLAFEGHLSVFNFDGGPCFRCLFPELPQSAPNCGDAGILGPVAGVLGTLQATETLKIILGIGTVATGRLMRFDALKGEFSKLKYGRDTHCPSCGLAGSVNLEDVPHLTVQELKARLERKHPVLLVDVREIHEREAARIEPSLHVPLSRLDAHEWPEGGDIVLYCQSGRRSEEAVRKLRRRGLSALHLLGGVTGYLGSAGVAD